MDFVESAVNYLEQQTEEWEKMLQLKKELAADIVKKLGEKTNDPMLELWQESVTNYLVSEWLVDDLEDIWIWMVLKTWISSQGEALKDYRKRINNAEVIKTESDLLALKQSIMSEIDGIQSAEKPQEQHQESSKPQSSQERLSASIDISQWVEAFYNQLEWKEKPDMVPFACAMQWYEKMKNQLWNPTYLTVVDFSKSNKTNRMFVINMATKKVEYTVPVWHWKNSWWEYATTFSDQAWTNQSSLWFYRTPQEITKAHTKSWSGLWMNGIEDSNNNAKNRWIYMHPWSVNWSAWCFTLPKHSKEIMKTLKWDSLLFAYYPQKKYFAQTTLIDNKPDRLVA